MTFDAAQYCLDKPWVEEAYPFGSDVTVFRVANKIFALMGVTRSTDTINLKCDPTRSRFLRQQYPEAITPGYHMNKEHWNTVSLAGEVPEQLVKELIDHSYELVAPKTKRA